jgi:hypothetical protein
MAGRTVVDTVPRSARRSARVFGAIKEGSDRRKLFHREERPALKRDIIDTSERARTNYRYVIGQHSSCKDIRASSANLQLCAKNLNVCVSCRLSTRSVMICERKWQRGLSHCLRVGDPALQRFTREHREDRPRGRSAPLPVTAHC